MRVPDAPVRAVHWLAGERALEQDSNLLIVDATGPTGTQFVIKSSQTVLDNTLPPLAHGGISPAQTTGRAIWVLLCPSADHSTTRARATRAWSRVREVARPGSWVCSSGARIREGLGRPVTMPISSPLLMLVIYGTQHREVRPLCGLTRPGAKSPERSTLTRWPSRIVTGLCPNHGSFGNQVATSVLVFQSLFGRPR